MRSPRIAILSCFFAACLFLLCRAITAVGSPSSVPRPAISGARSAPKSTLRSFFSFNTPFTLFPPNAIITIAEDNSTSFAARPAAFGPPIPSDGLNGQLWLGSGFTEEIIAEGEGDGELGCSDMPNWNDGSSISALKPLVKASQDQATSATGSLRSKSEKKNGSKGPSADRSSPLTDATVKAETRPVNDGTDDYLHQHLGNSQRGSADVLGPSSSSHADIQSMQEGAEIAGKIVLLSRGGCGFLEKVKWAQRRGAVGLIVGDNQRGGPLIQMYAHGDTSNVSIPSIFTSHTTAYLLSSLMQSGSFNEDTSDDSGKPAQKPQSFDRSGSRRRRASLVATSSQNSKLASKAKTEGVDQLRESHSKDSNDVPSRLGWFSRIFGGSNRGPSELNDPLKDSQHDWIVVEEFSDEKDNEIRTSLGQTGKEDASQKTNQNSRMKHRPATEDHFQIGVEDWRDPDLVGMEKSENPSRGTSKSAKARPKAGSASKGKPAGPSRGGVSSSTGSHAAGHIPAKGKDVIGSAKGERPPSPAAPGLISKIFGDGNAKTSVQDEAQQSVVDMPFIGRPGVVGDIPPPSEREGLWVVITPTSGASPFFDTLLVLVISPLITLTVVYALLILRARIRRRRWRAPKSVVEQLPVRTYHAIAPTPSRSSRLPSPISSSPTTPLLQSQQSQHSQHSQQSQQNQHDQRSPSRPRPRSRTTTGVPSAGDLLDVNSALAVPPSTSRPEHEKRAGSSEWKKYMGRQVECVVCLEEYVDGVSQVMSLPCGHEFHVDCM